MKTYYYLTKPGIIMGNIITTAAGFILASKGNIDYWLFLATLIGLSFVIASAGVFNNYFDRLSDEKMERTKNRPLVTGLVSIPKAIIFSSALGILGVIVLTMYTNLLTVMIALAGFFIYLVLYGIWKYRSFYGTLIGSLAGGVPPVVGYCAVSNRFDIGALILFLIIVIWQMPHFFAIAMYHFKDYAAASIPVLPVQRGMHATKIQMLLYIIAFIGVTLALTLFGYTGYAYMIAAALLGITWLALCLTGFKCSNDTIWARQMFICSLMVVTVLCLMISIDVTL
jgi:heme o synthase